MRRVVVLAGLAVLGACNALFGVDNLEYRGSGGAGSTSTSLADGGQGATGTGGDEGGTGGGGAEQCFNGIDDDANGAVDCGDPSCMTRARCAELPAGFSSFVQLRLDPDADEPCGQGYLAPVDGGGDPVLPAAACSSCGCGPPTGWSCNSPFSIRFEDDAACAGSSGQLNLFEDHECYWFNPPSGLPYAAAIERLTTGGSCEPAPAVPNGAPPSFGSAAQVCPATEQGQCETPSALCVPSEATCVMADGEASCPSEFPTRQVIYTQGFADGRSCGDCSCGEATPVPCIVTTEFYSDPSCTDLDTTWVHDTQCAAWAIPGIHYYSIVSAVPAASFACGASGGTPSGEVSATGPVTVCCP